MKNAVIDIEDAYMKLNVNNHKSYSVARHRFVIVRNPEEAERDRKKREGQPHKKATCALWSHETFGRYIHQAPDGKLCIDKDKVKAEEHLDGKYLLVHRMTDSQPKTWLWATNSSLRLNASFGI